MSQVFFEMNSYVMILVKIGVIHRNLFGGALFLQPTRQRVLSEIELPIPDNRTSRKVVHSLRRRPRYLSNTA